MRVRPLLAVAFAATPTLLLAQGPTGPEFQITTTAVSALSPPAVAADAAGNFVVVWEGFARDGNDFGVAGRRFDAAGAPRGAEFQVNAFTSGRQSRPAVASDAAGNLVVVWSSAEQDGSGDGIVGRRFDAGGVTLGGDFIVNTSTLGPQDRPVVASDPAGNILVAWESDAGTGTGVFGQIFDPGGNRIGPEFRVGAQTGGNKGRPAVAADAAGHFIAVYEGDDGSGTGILGRVFDAAGAPLGAEFRANATTADVQERPAVASDPAGNFVVVWHSLGQDGAGFGVFGQRFDASGTPLGPEFRVNTTVAGDQRDPAVAADATGFQVVWWSVGQGAFGQRYDPAGAPQGGEFRANTAGDVTNPRVLAGAGSFVVVWQSGSSLAGRK